MNETIEARSIDRVGWVASEFASLAWPKPDRYFRNCHATQQRDELVLLLARTDDRLHNYLKIIRHSEYPPFKERGFPTSKI